MNAYPFGTLIFAIDGPGVNGFVSQNHVRLPGTRFFDLQGDTTRGQCARAQPEPSVSSHVITGSLLIAGTFIAVLTSLLTTSSLCSISYQYVEAILPKSFKNYRKARRRRCHRLSCQNCALQGVLDLHPDLLYFLICFYCF